MAVEDLCQVWKHNVQMLILGCLIFRSDLKMVNDGYMASENPWLALCGNKSDGCLFSLTTEKELK